MFVQVNPKILSEFISGRYGELLVMQNSEGKIWVQGLFKYQWKMIVESSTKKRRPWKNHMYTAQTMLSTMMQYQLAQQATLVKNNSRIWQ